jgi:hypothetical protein
MDIIGCFGGNCNLKHYCQFYQNKISGKSNHWISDEHWKEDNNPDTCKLFSSKDIYNQLFEIVNKNN